MYSKRIIALASLITPHNKVLDIGTDHAYLPIYLVKEKSFNWVGASDISLKVLNGAYANLKKYNLEEKIPLYLSDGFLNIPLEYDTAVIAGMGFNTIKNILQAALKLPNELIIECHNNISLLRSFMQEIGYKIIKEIAIWDKNIYYIIIKYQKGRDNLTIDEIKFGKNYDLQYLKYLENKYTNLNRKNNINKYDEYLKDLHEFIEKIPD